MQMCCFTPSSSISSRPELYEDYVEAESRVVSCTRYCLYTFLVLYFISGLTLLGAGVTLLLDSYHYQAFASNEFFFLSVLLLGIGSVLLLVTALACCGTVRDVPCLLATSVGLLCFLFLLEVVVGVMAYTLHPSIKMKIEEQMWKNMELYVPPVDCYPQSEGTVSWDQLQIAQECCGVNGLEDWFRIDSLNRRDCQNSGNNEDQAITIPDSCCLYRSPGCGRHYERHHNVARHCGCLQPLSTLFIDATLRVGVMSLVAGLIQACGVVCTVCLAQALHNNEKKMYFKM